MFHGQYVAHLFRWIQQHVRVTTFFGITEKAVKSKIWNSVSVYVLVIIVRKLLNLSRTLYEILQISSLNRLQKAPLDMLPSRCAKTPVGLHPANPLFLSE